MTFRTLERLLDLSGFVGVACVALGCGSVDPADNTNTSGHGGSSGAGGDGGRGGQVGVAGEGGDGGDGGELPSGSLLPWQTGSRWSYRVTQDGRQSLKVTTVGELEEVGGSGPHAERSAFHVVTIKGADGTDRTESWQGPATDAPQRIVRYREQAFGARTGELQLEEHWDPPKLHIDGSEARMLEDSAWIEVYSETKLEVGRPPATHDVREHWTVLSADETVTVPAGTFEHAVHLRKTAGDSSKEYWYVRGVGKVKEVGAQTEELTEYSLDGEAAP
ncbi:MAG TPA: hypothetical protein VI197_34000 [Polyangiaceae bacterium]